MVNCGKLFIKHLIVSTLHDRFINIRVFHTSVIWTKSEGCRYMGGFCLFDPTNSRGILPKLLPNFIHLIISVYAVHRIEIGQ